VIYIALCNVCKAALLFCAVVFCMHFTFCFCDFYCFLLCLVRRSCLCCFCFCMRINCITFPLSRTPSLNFFFSDSLDLKGLPVRFCVLPTICLAFLTLYSSGTVVRITLTMDTFVCSITNCHQLIRADQSKLTCWLCEKMGHTKCAGYTGRTSDNLLYCCDPCLEVAHEMRSFMRQTKVGLIASA